MWILRVVFGDILRLLIYQKSARVYGVYDFIKLENYSPQIWLPCMNQAKTEKTTVPILYHPQFSLVRHLWQPKDILVYICNIKSYYYRYNAFFTNSQLQLEKV